MGSALMFKKMTAVKWFIAGAAALCGVFLLGCIGNRDVDEPLRVREALEIPLNFEMDLNDLAYDRVFDAVRKGIEGAVSDDPLGSDDLDALTFEIMEDEGILDYITTGDVEGGIYTYVPNLMKDNKTVTDILTRRGRLGDIDDIAEKAAKEMEAFYNERGTRLEDITESTSPEIPAPGDSLKLIDNPDITYDCVLDNSRCPFNFEIYAFFFKEEKKSFINDMGVDDFIEYANDPVRYLLDPDVVNLFYNEESDCRMLQVEAGKLPSMPPKSENMDSLLLGWFKGGKAPLGTRWVVRCLDEADEILKHLNVEGGEYFIDVKLKVGVEFTLDMGTLFDL